MIWIKEYASESENQELEKLNPFMDYQWAERNNVHIIETYCAGLHVQDGMIKDIRKARIFNIDNILRLFISDSIDEAKELCSFMNGFPTTKLLTKYPNIKSYWEKNEKNIKLKTIIVPVIKYLQYFSEHNPKLLDVFDLNELYEYKSKFDVHDYILRDHNEFGGHTFNQIYIDD